MSVPTGSAPTSGADNRSGVQHDAFISYHRESSHDAAHRLQRRLEDIARRNRIEPKLDIFLDDTGMRFGLVDEQLSAELRASRRLIVLLHCETQRSTYVNEEISRWLDQGGSSERLILARVDDRLDLSWDRSNRSFVHEEEFPAALRGVFDAEPLWIDFTRSKQRRGRDDAGQLARLCATLVERSADDLLQRELVAQRRRVRVLGGGLVGVIALLLVSILASVAAVKGRTEAREQRTEAEAQSQAAEALLVSSDQPSRSVDLLIAASGQSRARSVRSAVYQVLEQNDRLIGLLPSPGAFSGRPPSDIVFSPSGRKVAGWRHLSSDGAGEIGVALWDVETREVVVESTAAGPDLERVEFVAEDKLLYCSDDGVGLITLEEPVVNEIVLALDGDGECAVQPMRGGAYGVTVVPGDLQAVFVDAEGEVTVTDDADWLASGTLAEVAVVGRSSGSPIAVDAGGEQVATLSGLDDPQPGSGILWADDRGTIILRTTDGRVLRSGSLEADPTARRIGAPEGSLAVSEVRAYEGVGHLWLSRNGQLGWSFGPQTLDLSEFLAESGENSVPPAIWVNRSGTSAVVGFEGTAVTVTLSLPLPYTVDPEPSMSIARTDDGVSTFSTDRTEMMGAYERGLDSVALPAGADHMLYFFGGPDPERVLGSVVFDPTGRVAVAFAEAPLVLYSGEFGGPWSLTEATDTNAIAFSRTGDLLAAVGPTSPVAVYSTATQERLRSLVRTQQDQWSAVSALGGAALHPDRDGSSVVWSGRSSDTRSVDLGDDVRGVFALSPDGRNAVVATTDESLSSFVPRTVSSSGDVTDLPPECSGEEDLYRYVPGIDFRTDSAAAERQSLIAVTSSGSTVPCDGSDGGELVDVSEIIDYQIDGERGQILAHRPDGAIDVTTWDRDAGEPSSVILPETAAASSAALDDSGRYATAWVGGASTVSVYRRNEDDRWTLRSSMTTSIGDVLTVITDGDEGMVTVVGSGGTVESFDLESGRLLYRRELAISISSYTDGEVIRSASAVDDGDDYVIRFGTGRETGPITNGMRITAVSEVDRLRERLCEIFPADPGCAR